MGIKIFDFTFDGEQYTVEKGVHIYENRYADDKVHRDAFMNTERYKEVIGLAMKNGLRSFVGKQVVISFYDYRGRPFSLLVILNENNLIFVISVYQGRVSKPMYTNFVKVTNRINLLDYVLPYMPPEAVKQAIKEKRAFDIEKECREEDDVFLRAMQYQGAR